MIYNSNYKRLLNVLYIQFTILTKDSYNIAYKFALIKTLKCIKIDKEKQKKVKVTQTKNQWKDQFSLYKFFFVK